MIAEVENSPVRINTYEDHTMENGSHDNNSSDTSDSNNEVTVNSGLMDSPEQKKFQKQQRKIHKVKANIGKFFKENTICDMLPYNLKLIVLNNEMTMC